MSFAEYSQIAEDHASLLILIRSVGSGLTPKSFNKVFEKICRLRILKIANPMRVIALRYKRNYTIDNNAWGNFQAHRRVLGLISIGKCENENDATELCHLHEELKEQYEGTLLDSRLILFGSHFARDDNSEDLDTVGNCSDSNENICDKGTGFKLASETFQDPLNVNGVDNETADDESPQDNQNNCEESAENSELVENSQDRKTRELNSSHVLNFYSEDDCPDLEELLQEFLRSLFWVLEGKRLDRSNERLDHLTLMSAPFERKDSSTFDSDSRLYRKRCQGRLKKHLADLCLLSGVCGEAVLHYRTAVDILRAANDTLWMAGAFEGLAVALYLDLQGRTVTSQSMARNPSFSMKPGLSRLKEAKLRPSLRIMTPTVRNGLDLADNNSSSSSVTLPDDVLDNYREAIINYSKFPEAGIIEMEASLKACRILIAHQRILEAADFLQNVITINLELMEEEKIQRFMTLSNLYLALNMKRKAAFYSRVAAMHCISPSNPKQTWSQCYHLLVKSLPGFRLSLDSKEMPLGGPVGWSAVQLRVVHELVYTARRMGNASIASRHLSFLLHTMFDYLRNDECSELATILKSYTSKCTATHLSIALDDGTILPPVIFTRFPTVRSFRLLKLMPHCRPVHFRNDHQTSLSMPSNSSPFIYSPLAIKSEKSSNPEHYYWIEGETAEVEFQLLNPLPFEISIDGLCLTTDGVEVVCHPVDIILSPESGAVQVKLLLTPCQPGQLSILGYTTQVFGVKSQCRFREISHLSTGNYTTTVVPALPMLQVRTSLPKMESFCNMEDGECVVTSGSLSLCTGQSSSFELELKNVGKTAVERLDIILNSTVPQDILKRLLVWDELEFKRQLPLSSGSQNRIMFTVHGLSNFLSPADNRESCAEFLLAEHSFSSSLATLLETRDSSGLLTIEVLILIQYGSGGVGSSSSGGQDLHFCRQCSVSLTLDVQPSVYVTRWQLLPSLRSDDCHLELDIENCSSSDITIVPNQVLISSGKTDRLSLRVPHFGSVPSILPASSVESTDCNSSSLSCSESEEEVSLVRQHICNHVNIQWTKPSSGVSGKISLEGLWWTKPQFLSLQTLPITWAIAVNGNQVKLDSKVAQIVASPVLVGVTIVNCSALDLTDVVLSAHCCHDVSLHHENSELDAIERQMSDIAIPMGNTKTSLTKVSAGASAVHTFSFVFPWCGAYQLLCCCEASLTKSDLKTERQIWRRSIKMEIYNAAVTTV